MSSDEVTRLLKRRIAELEADNAYKEGMINKAFSILELYGVPRTRAKSVHNGIDVLMTRMDRQAALHRTMITDLMKVVAVAQAWADEPSHFGADILLREVVQQYTEKMKRLNEGVGLKPDKA